MTALEIILLITVLVAAFVLRLIPSWVNGWFGSDAFYHIMVARKTRELRRLPEKDPGLAPESTRTYPPLLHAILYPFAGRGEKIAMAALSPLLDVVAMLVLYWLTAELGIDQPLWPLVLYALSPMNIIDAASLNARPLANLALILSLSSMYMIWQTGGWAIVTGAAVFSAGVMLSNKMAFQVLIPCTLALFAVVVFYEPATAVVVLAALVLGMAVATAVTFGGYLRRTLPDHIRFVSVHIRHGGYSTGRRALPSTLNLLKANPLSVFGPVLGVAWLVTNGSDRQLEFLLAWALPVLLLAQFWIWGDSWRYLQFGTIPSVLIIVAVLTSADVDDLVGTFILVGAAVVLAIMTAAQLRRAIAGDPAAKLVDAMLKLPPEWKNKLKGTLVYSNVAHYSVPLELEAKMFSGNPSSAGMELYFRNMAIGLGSLQSVSDAAFKELGRNLDYYIMFKGFKQPSKDGFRTLFDSDQVSILAE